MSDPPGRVTALIERTSRVRSSAETMKRVVAIVVPCMLLATPADGRECRHDRPHASQGWASWRLINGRQCWYVGRGRLPKSQLSWAAPASSQSRLVPMPIARPGATFDDRWPR